MVGGTYLCEQWLLLSSNRPGLTNKHLTSLITVATTRSLKLTHAEIKKRIDVSGKCPGRCETLE